MCISFAMAKLKGQQGHKSLLHETLAKTIRMRMNDECFYFMAFKSHKKSVDFP